MKNDVKLCCSLLLQSYSVRCRLMNFLAKMAITYSWEILETFLEPYIENETKYVNQKAPSEKLMDNINKYRDSKKYNWLFKTFEPKM